MRWLADIAYALAGLAYLPVAIYNALVLGKNRRGWRERFGWVRRREPGRRRVWIHAVSLGEVNCTPKLVSALRRRLPEWEIVFSTTTDTGYARAVQLYGADSVMRFPLDFSLVISRALRRVRPSALVLVELEVWYNLVRMAHDRGIPVAIVNGRLTERSAKRFGLLGAAARSMFSRLAWVGAQDAAIAERFRGLGVADDRVEITSSLKWDTADVADDVPGADALAAAIGLDTSRPLWVCGSTGPGEEAMVLTAYRQLLDAGRDAHDETSGAPVLAIVPRKPERFDEVARLIEAEGFTCIRRSRAEAGQRNPAASEPLVLLGDTMGELRKFYALADAVFVGRSLVPMGGSDPIEVAALGKPMVVGPHMENFRGPVDALMAVDGIRRIGSVSELAAAIRSMLDNKTESSELGSRARKVVLDHQGATDRTADRLVELFEEHAPATGDPAGGGRTECAASVPVERNL